MNETARLAEFVTDTQYSDLPTEVIEKAKLLMLDQLGCQLAFATLPWCKDVYQYVLNNKIGKQESTVVCYGLKVSAEDAAFANAVFGHGFEMDDTELSTASHPGVAVIPAALAVAESLQADGKDLIAAIVTGYEVLIRVGAASHTMMNRGFHTTSVLGPLGAAAAVSKILGLDISQTVNALAIASSSSGGIAEYTESGGTVKRVHAGFAAANGLRAALLAKNGVTGPRTAIEGKKGFCRAYADSCSFDELTKDLGQKFEIMFTGTKPYCCCAAQHSAIDAVSAIMQEHRVVPEEIEKIRVRQKARDVRAIGSIIEPQDIVSAQFSGRFGIALRLVKGSNGFRDYSEENLSDKGIGNIVRRIEYEADEELEKANPSGAPATVRIQLKDGNTYEKTVQFAKGTVQNCMNRTELIDKFRELAGIFLMENHIREIIKKMEELEGVKDVRTLMPLLVFG
ncbi:MAG TPA: MmgE/PrpD family protein [Syntrophorhabdaceae bacterium]|nr:MmgE/PrpD family protein [Syntrophorhabdaceae bacterium]